MIPTRSRYRQRRSPALLASLLAVILFAFGSRLTQLEAGAPAVHMSIADIIESPLLTGEAEMVDPDEIHRLDCRLFGFEPPSDQPRNPFLLPKRTCVGFPGALIICGNMLERPTIESIMAKIGEIRVLSIMRGTRSLANVNDRVVRAGDTLTINREEVEVVAIAAESVRFRVQNVNAQFVHEFDVPLWRER